MVIFITRKSHPICMPSVGRRATAIGAMLIASFLMLSLGTVSGSDWRNAGGDAGHPGLSGYSLENNWGEVVRSVSIGAVIDDSYRRMVFHTPVMGADGTLYGRGDYHIHAVSDEGDVLWTYGGGVTSDPAMDGAGNVYFLEGSLPSEPKLTSLYSNGSLRWSIDMLNHCYQPVVSQNGDILVNSFDDSGDILVCLSSEGKEEWRYALGDYQDMDYVLVPIAASSDGMIYTLSVEEGLVALSSDGDPFWKLNDTDPWAEDERMDPRDYKLSCDSDGNLYVTCPGGLYSLGENGEVRWGFQAGNGWGTRASISDEGKVYFGKGDTLYILLQDGRVIGSCQFDVYDFPSGDGTSLTDKAEMISDIVIDAEGRMALNIWNPYEMENNVILMDSIESTRWWHIEDDVLQPANPIITQDGEVVISDGKGSLIWLGNEGDEGSSGWLIPLTIVTLAAIAVMSAALIHHRSK